MRGRQALLIGATLLGSWLGMQAIHETGHVLGAGLTDADVKKVTLHPLEILRTDLGRNPRPLAVAWAGPWFGSAAPLLLWGAAAAGGASWAFVLRFFAGFCLAANGLYIGAGSFGRVGDAGDLLAHGAELWQLWLFGAATAPFGLLLWHGQGRHFGFGAANGEVHRGAAYGAAAVSVALLVHGFARG